MHTRFVECGAVMVALVVGSCRFPSSSSPTCDDDAELCPHSSPSATSVTCDCHCTIGGGSNSANNFDGSVAVCLPPSLNAMTADGEQRVALDAMEPRTFDQKVYGYCSRSVAGFVRLAIKAHANLKLAACVMPVSCECKTEGTRQDTDFCHTPCLETPCTATTCASILRVGQKLDIGACSCSRSKVCGESQPAEEDPGICRDWMTSIQ